jgi:CheY-like chemotaxis protein
MIRVLIVESDPSLAWLYREELQDAGFSVGVCGSLSSALVRMRDAPAHVLVTDLNSVGDNPDRWLPRLRSVFDGPVLALGELRKKCREGIPVVPKTSDLGPLIQSLRGQALRARWFAAAGTC